MIVENTIDQARLDEEQSLWSGSSVYAITANDFASCSASSFVGSHASVP